MGAIMYGSKKLAGLAALAVAGSLALTGIAAAPATAASSTVTVKGHVRATSGSGVANVVVTAYYRTPSVGQFLSKKVRTSSTGRYEVKVPRSWDTYRLKVTDPGDNDRDTADGKWAPTLTSTFRSNASVILRNLTVQPGAQLSGRIYDRTGKPASGLEIHVSGAGQVGDPKTYTRADGAYYFKNLVAGEVSVLVQSPSSNGLARWYKRTNSSGTLVDTEASDVAVAAGKKATGISIYFPTVSKITGRVTVDGTQPFGEGGRYVSTVLYDGSGKRLYQDGYFTNPTFYFKDLPAGTYYLGFESATGGDPIVPEFYADKATLAQATPIVVKSGGAVSGLVANLESAPASQ